jgi:hypothetical protein
MNVQQQERFEEMFNRFVASGYPYTARDAQGKASLVAALDRLKEYAGLYVDRYNNGLASQSAFEIITAQLLAETDPAVRIRPLAVQEDPPAEDVAELARSVSKGERTIESISSQEFFALADANRVSVYELKRRYRGDKQFREIWDRRELSKLGAA